MSILQRLKAFASTNQHPREIQHPAASTPGDFSILDDDFLGWLRFANAGMLDNGNVVAMDYAIARMPAGATIEIGSFCGLSANVIAHLRRRHRKHGPFFAADPWLFEGADIPDNPMGDGGITFGEYRLLVRDSFIRNVSTFSRHDMPHAIETTSDNFFNHWDRGNSLTDVFGRTIQLGGPIAFAYIDGDHRYAQSRRDFENIDRNLVAGGFILFDDSADGTGWEVCRLVKEIEHDRTDYRLIGKYGNYLFQKTP